MRSLPCLLAWLALATGCSSGFQTAATAEPDSSHTSATKPAPAVANDNWLLSETDDACVLESATVTLDDGYTETKVRLRISGHQLRALTGSTIDLNGDDLGMRVDDNEIIPFETIEDETNARLSGDFDDVAEQFIRGGKAQLRLRFWPTWPSQGIRTADFSLIGFTKAWKAYTQCR